MTENDKNNYEQLNNSEKDQFIKEFYSLPLRDRMVVWAAFWFSRVKKNFAQLKNLFWIA